MAKRARKGKAQSTGISFDSLVQNNEQNIEPNKEQEQAQEQEQEQAPSKPKKVKKPTSKKSKIIKIILGIILIAIFGYGAYTNNIKDKEMQAVYKQAQAQMESGNFQEAYNKFVTIAGYSDASAMATQCLYSLNKEVYDAAMKLKEEGLYDEAILKFGEIDEEFEDTSKQVINCYDTKRELYIDKMGVLVYKINKYKELASSMTDIVYKDWLEANTANKDATVVLQETFKTWSTDIRQLNIGNKGLASQVEALGEFDATDKTKDTTAIYEQFIQYFGIYNEIHKQAVEPSGDIKNYKERILQYSKEFDSILEKMYVTEPAIKRIVNREVEAANIAEQQQEISIVPVEKKQEEKK